MSELTQTRGPLVLVPQYTHSKPTYNSPPTEKCLEAREGELGSLNGISISLLHFLKQQTHSL